MTIHQLYEIFLRNPQVETDTRKLQQGAIFFALSGPNFNGNKFALQALEMGASYAITDEETDPSNQKIIVVHNVLEALQQLAKFHRQQLNIPFIATTGSNGKTTTKELVNSVLASHYITYTTQGNLNNHIGIPLTLLRIKADAEMAVIEMGANHQKEIAGYCEYVMPTHGIITNCGKAHLEGFGGIEGVRKGKGELYDYLKSNSGIAFINQDNLHLKQMAEIKQLTEVIYYSTNSESVVRGELVENDPFLIIDWLSDSERHHVKSNLTGPYNLENILAAIAIGRHFKLTPEEINLGITSYNPENNRSQITKTATNTLICDYYNANPSSMFAALENFDSITAKSKVIILGDMFELGEESSIEHQSVLEKASNVNANERIFIGKHFSQNQISGARFYDTVNQVCEAIRLQPIKDATILIKGSRGMALEKLVEFL